MPPREPVQERARQRRDALLDAAARLLDDRGWDALTTRALAAEAGVAVGTVYDYFGDRDGVLLALLERYERRLADGISAALDGVAEPSDVPRAAHRAVDAFAQVWFEEPGYAAAWLGTRNPELLDRTAAAWSARFEPLVAAPIAALTGDAGIARVVAGAAIHLVSGMLLAAATGPRERREPLVEETRVALAAYLAARLGPVFR
ncbi:MAG: TetR/AcrR family transcriptional regulator [Alphaproteobacteria bacterium]|nr:TetR/AcrR family transcriptional regulator [Alphaproteobacteria bacterium]